MNKLVKSILLSLCLATAFGVVACNGGGTNSSVEETKLSISTVAYTYTGKDVKVIINNLSKAEIESVKQGQTTLTSEYLVSQDTLTLTNAYLSALEDGKYGFTVTSNIGSVAFSVTVPETEEEIGEPIVTPKTIAVEISELSEEGLSVEVRYNGGSFSTLSMEGEALPPDAYALVPGGLTLSSDYLKGLGAGEYTFTVGTNGGACSFVITLNNSKLYSDVTVVEHSGKTESSVPLYGAENKNLEYYLNGAKYDNGHFSIEGDSLIIANNAFKGLKKDIYTLEVVDEQGDSVSFFVINGLDEYFYCDYDTFLPPAVGYGQDLEISTVEGLNGNGGRVVNKGQGTLLVFDEENISFDFAVDTTYAISFDMKVNSAVEGSGTLNIAFPFVFSRAGKNGDVGYIFCEPDAGWRIATDWAGQYASMTETEFGYHVYIEFVYQSDFGRFEIPSWTASDIVFDNIKMIPVDGKMDYSASYVDSVEYGLAKAIEKDLGDVTVLGVKVGDAFVSEEQAVVSGGKVTFTQAYLNSLEKGNTVPYSIHTDKGVFLGKFEVSTFSIILDGNLHYTGEDIACTLSCGELVLESVSLGDKTLTNEEYSLTGNTFVLKANALDGIMGKEELCLAFVGGQTRTYTVTSKTIYKLDFDKYPAPLSGYAIGVHSAEVVAGATGNEGKITVTDSSATLFAFGGSFINADLQIGTRYAFSMTFHADSVTGTENFTISGSNCFIPITFGSGNDVVYLQYANGEFAAEAQSACANIRFTQADGVYTLYFETVYKAGMGNLTFDIWMPCTLYVDNISFTQK